MRLYTLSKRHFVLVFVVFFACFGLTVFIGIRGKARVWVLLSFIVPSLHCFLAQPAGPTCSLPQGPCHAPAGWRGDPASAPHSRGLRSAWQRWATLTV